MRGASFASGQLLFQRGDPGDDICLILKGRIRLSILSPEGRALSFLIAGPGDIFGEIAALDGGVRTADATAAGETVVAMLPRTALLRLIETRPAVAKAAIDFVCARLRATDDRLEAIALYPIEARLARFLISALRLRGVTAGTGRAELNLPMSQTDIACMIGASRPKVNGALASLEGAGAIRRDGERIDCDLDRLRAIAEGEGA
jgi:CRP-like cAMP-binding protein